MLIDTIRITYLISRHLIHMNEQEQLHPIISFTARSDVARCQWQPVETTETNDKLPTTNSFKRKPRMHQKKKKKKENMI